MLKLNLPEVNFKFKKQDRQIRVFDIIRKKYVNLTPEEWVRQHFIHYLINEKGVPTGLISVEMGMELNNLMKRADVVVFDKNSLPFLIVECKAPHIKITQEVFDQIARYNSKLLVKYLIVTNGIQHFACELDYKHHSYSFLDELPIYRHW